MKKKLVGAKEGGKDREQVNGCMSGHEGRNEDFRLKVLCGVGWGC